MDYSGNLNALVQYAGDEGYANVVAGDGFLTQLPIFIQSAELRILRDLDLLSTRVQQVSGYASSEAMTPFSRIQLPPSGAGTWQVWETIALVGVNVNLRTAVEAPLTYLSKEALDAIYPSDQAVGAPSIPRYWAPFDNERIIVGPAPGFPFGMQVYGVQFPATLSPGNSTFISVNLPDLFLAAEMIDVSAWCKQFSAMADNPVQARNWTDEYDRLKAQAQPWELRRKLQASGWSSRLPNMTAAVPPGTKAVG